MVSRRDAGSWLEPRRAASGDAAAYPGSRLGRPADGRGSVAGFGRRVVALLVDWVLCLLVAGWLLRHTGLSQFGPLLVLLVENILLVGTVGATIGHRALGLRVESLADAAAPGFRRAVVRSVLLCLAIPPLLWDADQRGLHDRAAGTLVARA